MRIVAALLAAVVTLAASGQVHAKKEPLTDEERQVVQVFEATGYTRDQIYAATQVWIAENFESAKAVVEYEGKDDGVIVGNGNIAYPCTGGFGCRIRAQAWRVGFTMKAEAKDGRFRLTFTNVRLLLPPYSNMGTNLPAREEPVTQREDMQNIRAKLLEFGPSIVANLEKAKTSEAW
jgi:hypothetical protein